LKLLLIEDDAKLVGTLRPLLQGAGYAVETAGTGIDGQFLGDELDVDLIILDLGLPDKNGLEVLRHWRKHGNRTPVLVLTARDAWHERVDGLKLGADDYLGKPFHSAELLARLEAILRRQGGRASNQLSWNGATLNIESQKLLTQRGDLIALTGTEFRTLRYLMQHPNTVHSKSALSEHVYEEDRLCDSNVIEVYINRLRQYLGKDFIETRRGQGYQLAPESQP